MFLKKEVKNQAIIISGITALLYYVGYIYESIYLGVFGFLSDELMPDSGRLIAYGFNLVFFEFVKSNKYIIAPLIIFGICKQPIVSWAKQNQTLVLHAKVHIPNGISDVIKYGIFPILTILIFLFVYTYSKELAEKDINKSGENPARIYLKEGIEWNDTSVIEGSIVRYVDGKIGVYSHIQKKAFILPERNIKTISYGKLKE